MIRKVIHGESLDELRSLHTELTQEAREFIKTRRYEALLDEEQQEDYARLFEVALDHITTPLDEAEDPLLDGQSYQEDLEDMRKMRARIEEIRDTYA